MAIPLPKIVGWRQLTDMVNEMKPRRTFLRQLLFPGADKLLHTETVMWSVRSRGWKSAGFVARCAEAIMVDGYSEVEREVTAPNIRLKSVFEPCHLLFDRRAGTAVFPDETEVRDAILDEISTKLALLEDDVSNTEEWMAAKSALGTGVLTYSTDRAAFEIDYLKPAANNMTAAVLWTTPATAVPVQDVLDVKRRMYDEVGLQPTHAIVGADAHDAILGLLNSSAQLAFRESMKTDSGINLGGIDLQRNFESNGAMFIGRMFGIDFWAYGQQIEVNGAAVDLVRPKYIEFVHVGPSAMRQFNYAAIPDMTLIQEGRGPIRRRRFVKSWLQEDPSELYFLMHTRPLPVIKRPGALVSLLVSA